MVLLACAYPAHALESLRVGSQLLVVGDSAARVKALLGKPSSHSKSSSSQKSSSKNSGNRKNKSAKSTAKDKGEKWQYRRDGHTTIITMVDGKVAHIEDLPR
ncbi:DUF2845 domain-containing protein [Dyella psychrodurans]|uniref:DUF2845 domain-containing protein n=2 Tax=Dyella psychrodurans TaxID=1927960 RepID=A0A370X4X4_9GAMM|nr:DUF2845 domain-containing protein [Dyella psychrodurans]